MSRDKLSLVGEEQAQKIWYGVVFWETTGLSAFFQGSD